MAFCEFLAATDAEATAEAEANSKFSVLLTACHRGSFTCCVIVEGPTSTLTIVPPLYQSLLLEYLDAAASSAHDRIQIEWGILAEKADVIGHLSAN